MVFSSKYQLCKFYNIKLTVEVRPWPVISDCMLWETMAFQMCLALRDFIFHQVFADLRGCRMSVHQGGFMNSTICPAPPTWQRLANYLFLEVGRGPLYQFTVGNWDQRGIWVY